MFGLISKKKVISIINKGLLQLEEVEGRVLSMPFKDVAADPKDYAASLNKIEGGRVALTGLFKHFV